MGIVGMTRHGEVGMSEGMQIAYQSNSSAVAPAKITREGCEISHLGRISN